jgi:hypothetical protein
VVRRALRSGALALAALIPPVVWLWPALARGAAPSFRDQADFFFPLKLHTVDRLRAGTLPLWNPLSGGGEPWLANAQSGVFYPPTLLFLIPSPGLAAALFLLAHFALAAWGMWRFCKEEGVTDAGALAACAVFCGSGLTASLSAYWNHFGAFAYLPGILALARSGLRSRAAGAGLAALIGLQAMAGSPEISAGTLALALVFLVFRREEPEGGWRPTTPRETLRRGTAAAALGLALAAWVLLPMTELAWHSERRAAIPAAERDLGAVGSGALASAIGAGEGSLGNYFFASFSVGPLALAAVAGAFAERQRRGLVWILAAVAAAGIVLAAAAPPGTWLRELPGFNRVRYPAKALAGSLFATAVLAGLGLDSLRFLPERRTRLLLCLLAAALGAAVVLSRPEPAIRAATAAGTVALILLTLLRPRSPVAGPSLAAAAALCLLASFAVGNRSVFRFVPGEEIRRVPESSAFLASVPGRVLTPPMRELAPWVARDFGFDAAMVRRQREALIGYTNLLAGVRTIRSAAALGTEACRRMTEAIDGSEDPSRAAGAAAGRVFWTPFLPAGLGSRKVGDFYRAPLNPYRPRVSLVGSYSVEKDPARAWTMAVSEQSDWSRRVILDREPSPRPTGAAGRYLIARISEEKPERLTIDVAADTPGILVLADMAYPGWKASVDGKPATLLTADGLFRAVAVEAGSHKVVFRYRPLSFYAGAAVSLAALAALALWSQRRTDAAGRAA